MRKYVDTSHFRAPFDSPQLDMAGLGEELPTVHRYFDTSDFRAPYDQRGYFQDNTLLGLGTGDAGQNLASLVSSVADTVCPVKDPIRNPYTVTAALLGGILGVGLGFVIGRVLR